MKDAITNREQEAARLEAKAKALRRAEKAFWTEVEERLPEIKERFHLSDADRFEEPAFWAEVERRLPEAKKRFHLSDRLDDTKSCTEKHQNRTEEHKDGIKAPGKAPQTVTGSAQKRHRYGYFMGEYPAQKKRASKTQVRQGYDTGANAIRAWTNIRHRRTV